MALVDTKIIKVIIPNSYTNSVYEEYEWLLEWYNKEGTPTYYMFFDWEAEDITETTPINISTDDIQSLINAQERNVTIVAEDVKREDLAAFQSLQVAKNVARIYKNGSRERVAIKSSSISYVNSKQRYRIELKIQRRQVDLIV